MTSGRITFRNGTSNSGKSSIAREFLDNLEGDAFHLAVGNFYAMRSNRELETGEPDGVMRRTRMGCPLRQDVRVGTRIAHMEAYRRSR
ncbi:phosphotransferase-like protein [Streptomyces antibioticus]|uniref:Chloramphenicol phosphotransferase n=1 Tax=Streptomyces antibioticus TaxID=1890 RepID=A0AAE6Y346_STRAT|nr:hypothetical protein [Streptomyces antibioticus]QIT42148.1 hypothetical protein HCX60_00185 [Streptomyces antibioticus]